MRTTSLTFAVLTHNVLYSNKDVDALVVSIEAQNQQQALAILAAINNLEAERGTDDALLAADYVVTIEQQRAQLTGTLSVEVLEEGLHAVPLDVAAVGLAGATLDDSPAAIGRGDDGRLTLLVEGVGRHELVLKMVAPLETTAARQVLHFRLPRPAAATMRLTVPGDVEVKSGAEVVRRAGCGHQVSCGKYLGLPDRESREALPWPQSGASFR